MVRLCQRSHYQMLHPGLIHAKKTLKELGKSAVGLFIGLANLPYRGRPMKHNHCICSIHLAQESRKD